MSSTEDTDPTDEEAKLEFTVPKSLDVGDSDHPLAPPDEIFVNTNRPREHLVTDIVPPPAPRPPRINTNGPPKAPPRPPRINTNRPIDIGPPPSIKKKPPTQEPE